MRESTHPAAGRFTPTLSRRGSGLPVPVARTLAASWVPQARGCPCPIAGRSLRASCPPVARCWPRSAILAALGQQRRLRGTGNPEPSNG